MTPPRLDKKQESSNMDRVIAWADAHATLIVGILIFVLFILMVLLVSAFANTFTIESGVMRNFLVNGV